MKKFNNEPLIPIPNGKVEIIELPAIEVEIQRYNELIAKEERLLIMENALAGMSGFSDIEPIKKIFNIKENKTK